MSFTLSSSAGGGRAAVSFMTNSWTIKSVAAVKGQLGGRGRRAIAMVKNGPSQQHYCQSCFLSCLGIGKTNKFGILSSYCLISWCLWHLFSSQKKQCGLGPALADSKIQLLPLAVDRQQHSRAVWLALLQFFLKWTRCPCYSRAVPMKRIRE